MRSVYLILIYLLSILIFSSTTCFRPLVKVSIDSIHYFEPNKIILRPDDFNFSSIKLNTKDGWRIFYKDSIDRLHNFKADKDNNNYYIIEWITTNAIYDSYISATIHYQAFDKKRQLNSSKIEKLKDQNIPLKSMVSFRVLYKDYDKVFKGKG